jgi:HEAT repeat protein
MAASVQSIVAGVLAKDYAVQLRARGAGPGPVPELARLLGDPDPEVRLLAAYCLAETGDPSAGPALSSGIVDDDAQVAMASAKGLHAVASPPLAPSLVASLDRVHEPMVRREVALVLERIAQPPEIAAMKERWEGAAGLEREGLTVALAARGDEDARKEFADRLVASSGDERLRWLESADRVGQPWLLRALAKVLGDPTPVLRVGVDARPDLIEALRACDLALVTIAKITQAKLSFPVTGAENYTPAQLDEARRAALAQAP